MRVVGRVDEFGEAMIEVVGVDDVVVKVRKEERVGDRG